ncbi:MAG: AMP-binding protein, partial [Clostridia bacterium]|nr:AMP-binding protein [Clostridia bacterium]
MQQTTGLNFKIQEMAHRIRELREIENYTIAEMAMKTGVSEQEYIDCELGRSDLNFAFLYRCALAFGVDVSEIIEGSRPNLNSFTVTRRGQGQRIEEAHDMVYYNLAASFRNRIAEPLYVHAEYSPEAEHEDIKLTSHQGQELDIVIEGQLKVQVGEHISVLNPGDSIYYDSGTPHGMTASGGRDCLFYAIVLNPTGEPIPELTPEKITSGPSLQEFPAENGRTRVWHRFADVVKDENGTPTKITFKNTEKFNFAFDVMDAIAEEVPNKLAMLHLDRNKQEHRFTFRDIHRASNRCANYFKALGIKKGDRVMLVLKRHYQFWFAILGLEKIGAIAIPATAQLQEHDFEYRFNAAGVKAILCTADGDTAHQAELAAANAPSLELKLIVNGTREGWHPFDEEYLMYSTHYNRPDDAACGEDLMLMYFTSGTTGYPKIAAHSFTHPLGHLHTAKYWHCVNPNGLHLTISDTGWAKAGWGKIYGQWLCEAAIFVYDFDRFDAADILPLFAKYHITTFCAPPTMYRMLIKQDLSKYDLSSVTHASSAGEALNPEVYRQVEKQTGLQVMEGFGQSESTMIIGNLAGADHKLGSMGKVTPIYQVSLLDPDGNPVPTGKPGEICIDISKGSTLGMFRVYYRDAEK